MQEPRALSIRFQRSNDGLAVVAVADPGRSIVLGRDLTCDVRLDGRKVSRRHLRIENRTDGVCVVADAGSHNGTFVNGARISEAAVRDGDVVTAGEWEGRIELRPVPRRAAPPGTMPVVVGNGAAAAGSGPTPISLRAGPHLGFNESTGTFDGLTDPSTRPPPGLPPRVSTPTAGRPPAPGDASVVGAAAASIGTPGTPGSGNHLVAPRPVTMAMPRSTPLPAVQSDWKWEEAAPVTDSMRAARVDDNPIVRRFAETSSGLDFRGLTDLQGSLEGQPSVAGLRPAQAIDAIALRLVFRVTEALQTTDSMEDFLREMCESLAQAARAKGVLVLLPDASGTLVPVVMKLRRADEKVQLSRTVVDYAVRNKAATTTEDASADERFARGESVLRFDLKAVLCVPLVRAASGGEKRDGNTGGDVIGALYLTRDLPFSNTERDLVAALAQLIAVGLERARLREEYAQADRTRRSLERFHAPDVVRRLMMDTGQTHRDGLFLEPLLATVLFCDLAGFTTYCENHEAEEVGKLLNSYLATMTETVFAHGGTVDKFIGDAVMCIFGAPFMAHDDALRAVRCAIDMRKNFRALVRTGACGEDAKDLDVHIGINTGKVVAGTVGSARRMEYTALGDTVNTAARLEGVAKKGQIVLGPTTAGYVHQQIPVRGMGPVALKGKGQTLDVWEVPDDDA